MIQITYLQNRNKLTDIEDRLVVVRGEGGIENLQLADANYRI